MELFEPRPPTEIDWVALGEYRLRDLEKPEEIFQAAHPELPAPFPPLRALTKATTNLPVQVTAFVGREQEQAELTKLVRGSQACHLDRCRGFRQDTIGDANGGQPLSDEFADGVWLVDLAPVSEPELVIDQVAAVLGVERAANVRSSKSTGRSSSNSPDDVHPRQLRAPHRRRLPGDPGLARWHRACRGSSPPAGRPCISRARSSYVVPPLGVPGAGDESTYERPDGSMRFACSSVRAEAVRPGFRLTAESARAILEICRRLDGIPLAIELAAARLASFTPQQIADISINGSGCCRADAGRDSHGRTRCRQRSTGPMDPNRS